MSRFNEAPAERGGKSPAVARPAVGVIHASMRPPQNAGESTAAEPAGGCGVAASMRPPQNAGESVVLPAAVRSLGMVLQ